MLACFEYVFASRTHSHGLWCKTIFLSIESATTNACKCTVHYVCLSDSKHATTTTTAEILANFACKNTLVWHWPLFCFCPPPPPKKNCKLPLLSFWSAQRVVYQLGFTLDLSQPLSPSLGDLSFSTLAHGPAQATPDLQRGPESV